MKVRLISAIALLVVAALLVAMFFCLIYFSDIVNQKAEEEQTDVSQQVGDAIGAAFLLILALPLSFTWLALAVIFIIYGLLMLLKRQMFTRSAKGLVALVVLSAVLGVFAILGLSFTHGIFEIFSSGMTVMTIVAIILYVANFVLEIIHLTAVKKEIAGPMTDPSDDRSLWTSH